MNKLLAIVLLLALAAGITMYNIQATDHYLYHNPAHKCGGTWQVSERNASWWHCTKCGEWYQIK